MSEGTSTKHMGTCRKRAAELRDELLFKQPRAINRNKIMPCCTKSTVSAATIPTSWHGSQESPLSTEDAENAGRLWLIKWASQMIQS
eukprot:scaffold2515_cov206-Skeletonema_marinoi.AAC.2